MKYKKGNGVKYTRVVKGYLPERGTGKFIRYNTCSNTLAYVKVDKVEYEVCCYVNTITLLSSKSKQLLFSFMN